MTAFHTDILQTMRFEFRDHDIRGIHVERIVESVKAIKNMTYAKSYVGSGLGMLPIFTTAR